MTATEHTFTTIDAFKPLALEGYFRRDRKMAAAHYIYAATTRHTSRHSFMMSAPDATPRHFYHLRGDRGDFVASESASRHEMAGIGADFDDTCRH